jgi:hypothetical protein
MRTTTRQVRGPIVPLELLLRGEATPREMVPAYGGGGLRQHGYCWFPPIQNSPFTPALRRVSSRHGHAGYSSRMLHVTPTER